MFVSIGEWVRLLQIVKYRIEIYNKHQSFASIFAQKHNILGSLGRGSASWKGLLQRNTYHACSQQRAPWLAQAQAFIFGAGLQDRPEFFLTTTFQAYGDLGNVCVL